MSDPLNFYFGRRGTIFTSAIFCLLPVFGAAVSQNWVQLLMCRLLLGLGMGCKGSTIPIYAAENSPGKAVTYHLFPPSFTPNDVLTTAPQQLQ